MRFALGHILVLLSALFLTLTVKGQSQSDLDKRLNRYELLCSECLDLRTKVNSGERVSRTEAASLINRFVAMNAEIKADSTLMTRNQKARFEAISQWFTKGSRPKMLDYGIRIEQLRPAPVGKASTADMTLLTSTSTEPLQGGLTNFIIRPQYLVLGTASLPDMSFGVIMGIRNPHKTRWGGYVHFKSDFDFTRTTYSCTSEGELENGSSFWPGGKSRTSVLSATAGGMVEINRWISLYAGAGYGYDRLIWDDIEGNWTEVSSHSASGISTEVGALINWRRMVFGLGISSVQFQTAAVDISIGIHLF